MSFRLAPGLAAILAAAAVPLSGTAKDRGFGVDLGCDHADCFYRTGETCVFEAKGLADARGTAVTNGAVDYVIDNFGTNVFVRGRIDFATGNPVRISFRPPEPGCYRLRLLESAKFNGKGRLVRGPNDWGIACEPEKLRKGSESPDDFDAFWAAARAACAKLPLDEKVERVDSRCNAKYDVYTVSFATVGRPGARVYGVMSVPKGAPGERFPLQVTVPGAGFGGWTESFKPKKDRVCLMMGVLPWVPGNGVDSLDRERDFERLNAECAAHYGDRLGGITPYYLMWGIEQSREDYYLYPVVLGIDRAVEWAATRDYVDPERVWYWGTSQGGYFGVMLTALNRRFTRAAIFVPGGSDVLGARKGRPSGNPRPYENFAAAPELCARAVANAVYFDGANFASRIRCPCTFVAGLADATCPPPGIWATYNEVKAEDRRIVTVPGMTHMVTGKVYGEIGKWLVSGQREK